MVKKITLGIFIVVIAIHLAGCIARNISFGNSGKWLPADFDPGKNVLLIERGETMTKEEKKMEEYMKEKYPYRYFFVTNFDVVQGSAELPLREPYRYALRSTYSFIMRDKGSVNLEDFYFYDRIEKKNYAATGKGSYKKIITFKPLINTILKEKGH